MKRREQAHPGHGRSQSRLHLGVVPVVVVMLMGQFAPVGLLTPGESLDHDCPHCAGAGGHSSPVAATGLHHEGHDDGGNHHDVRTTTGHHPPRSGETSFCGCGADGTSLTILPPIGKTLVAKNPVPIPRPVEFTFADPVDRGEDAPGSRPFHPPRTV